jgi:hypothetical protein
MPSCTAHVCFWGVKQTWQLRGFGFIRPDKLGGDVFFSRHRIIGQARRPCDVQCGPRQAQPGKTASNKCAAARAPALGLRPTRVVNTKRPGRAGGRTKSWEEAWQSNTATGDSQEAVRRIPPRMSDDDSNNINCHFPATHSGDGRSACRMPGTEGGSADVPGAAP